ncbi:MAG: Uma2 family endonuclease [Deltaproteobacteria bacterium]|nr:Uma2 family endonuclease [Deltaproteobacteria bacterium]
MLREEDHVDLPRSAVRFPLELVTPAGLDPDDPATWPSVNGRLEYVGGKLLFMPPCADTQQYVAADASFVLRAWTEGRDDFLVGTNEAGMRLGGETRGADAAVWRRADVGSVTGRFQRVPPLLAVEVAGQDEGETELRIKASWYLEHGVRVVWLVLPDVREVVVVRPDGESRHGLGGRLPAIDELPGLEPPVDRFFKQIV